MGISVLGDSGWLVNGHVLDVNFKWVSMVDRL